MRHDVGIGEYKVSKTGGDELKTYSLGSCVAVCIFDNKTRVAGLIHIALPSSEVNREKAARKPGYFTDTGLPALLKEMRNQGAVGKNMVIKIAGGSCMMDENNRFDIGKRNVLSIKRYLWKYGLGVMREDVGGNVIRTVSIIVNSRSQDVFISNSHNKWQI